MKQSTKKTIKDFLEGSMYFFEGGKNGMVAYIGIAAIECLPIPKVFRRIFQGTIGCGAICECFIPIDDHGYRDRIDTMWDVLHLDKVFNVEDDEHDIPDHCDGGDCNDCEDCPHITKAYKKEPSGLKMPIGFRV